MALKRMGRTLILSSGLEFLMRTSNTMLGHALSRWRGYIQNWQISTALIPGKHFAYLKSWW